MIEASFKAKNYKNLSILIINIKKAIVFTQEEIKQKQGEVSVDAYYSACNLLIFLNID
uniref:Uncharacterized protein n=1 Tax=Rhizophora mucronata TaxID=61149 RepID=A0A2P2K5G1_RHIMU